MHTSTVTISRTIYECFDCGGRVREPETRSCDRCDGELKNLSRARDL